MSNPAKKSRTNRFGVTAPVALRTSLPSGTGLIGREQRAAIAEAERFLRQNQYAIDAAVQAAEQNQDVIDAASRLAEDEAEAIAEAQRMVERHQKAFDLLR